MRHSAFRFIVATLSALGCTQAAVPAYAADHSATVSVRLTVASSTSLQVSSSVLRFEVSHGAPAPTVAIDFSAGARTYKGGEVLLTVERAGTMQASNGGPSDDLAVAYEGEGQAGTLAAVGPSTAGRWIGSGRRQGRMLFTLRGATAPGTYLLPVKFVLSAP